MKTLSLIIGLFFGSMALAQVQEPSNSISPSSGIAQEGSFQFISKTPKKPELFTTDILTQIESKRLENKDQYWEISDQTTVYIPSLSKIMDRDFVPLKLYADD